MRFYIKNLILTMTGGFLILLSSYSSMGFNAPAKIEGFKLSSCGSKKCLTILSSHASNGSLGNYAFEEAVITITNKKTKKTQVLSSKDVFYDFLAKKIYIRQILEKLNSEAIYDLKNEKLTFYAVRKNHES